MTAEVYDIVVIGGGPAGENVADYAIRGSNRTALLVEHGLLGGECSYYACMPSKALLRPLEVRASAEQLGGLPDRVPLDVPALLARRDTWVSNYDDSGQAQWAAETGIELARGTARLAGERRLKISSAGSVRDVVARQAVVVASGSRPVIPAEFDGLEPWTSRDATGIQEVPESIGVIGGGVVAVEAAHWLAALGAKVTLLVRGDRLLARFEDFAGELVADGLRSAGVDLRFGVRVTEAWRERPASTGLGRVHGSPVTMVAGGERLSFAEVLVAAGRKPATGDLGLDTIGLTPESFAQADRRPGWLHAVGDASGDAPLTHWGKYAARLTGERIAAAAENRPAPPAPTDVPVPQVVFTDPQVASVGLTEPEARSDGTAVDCVEEPMSAAAGYGLLRDDAPGRAKLVFEAGAGRLLGATFVGTEVAELVHAATVAIVGRLTADVLWHAVPSYPTASEVWLRLLDACRSR